MSPQTRMSPLVQPIPLPRSGTPARPGAARIVGADPGSRSTGE